MNLHMYKGADVTVAQHLESLGISRNHRAWHLYEAWLGPEFGTCIDRVGMRSVSIAMDLWKAGETNFLLQKSYLDTLVEVFELSTVVSLIQYAKEVTEVNRVGRAVEIVCRDQSRFKCRATVVAVPLTMLKSSLTFNPPLPATMQTSLSQLAMDAGMKVVLFFSRRFWGDKVCELTLAEEAAWDPGYFKQPRDQGPYVISFLITGRHAEELTELKDEDKATQVLRELDSLYDGQPSLCYSHCIVKDWTKEPFIRGAYSYPLPGSYRSYQDHARRHLAAGADKMIMLAGEAVALSHSSTVHGAMESAVHAVHHVGQWLKESNARS